MIRRWSRVNLSNFTSYTDYVAFGSVQHLKTFRVTTHFKRFYFGFTKHKRRKAACKNRLSFLVPQLNVIGLWSQEYRFFRHTVKFNYTNNLFLHNYSLHNHVMYANKDALHKNHFEHFITAATSARVVNYYASKNINTFTLNKSMRSSLFHILSTPYGKLVDNWNPEDKTLSLVGVASQTSIYPLTIEYDKMSTVLHQAIDNHFTTYLTQRVSIYQIMVMTFTNSIILH